MEEVQKGQRGGPVCKCLRIVVFNEEEFLQTWEGHRGGPLHFMNLIADMNDTLCALCCEGGVVVGTQEDFLACMKLRMANILVEAEAVVAAMAVQNGLRRQSGATDTSDQRRTK